MATGNQPSSTRRGWRAEAQQSAQSDVVRHDWQRGTTTDPNVQQRNRERWRRVMLATLGVVAMIGMGILLNQVLFAPVRTPVFAVVATNYEFPIPPNAWAQEDLLALRNLNAGTFDFHDMTDTWDNPRDPVDLLKREITSLNNRSHECLVIYLNMHGAVKYEDGQAVACLLPGGASAVDAGGWISVADVLAALRETPTETNKMLVLDVVKVRSNLDMGLLENDFVEQISALVEAAEVSNLAVLVSTSGRETSQSGKHLQGTAFGHYFVEGFAGAADRDRDRQVSTNELADYLGDAVSSWSKKHRGVEQTPRLFSAPGTSDFPIAWVTRSAPVATTADRSVSSIDTAPLWKRRDELRDKRLGDVDASGLRVNPLAWRSFDKRLVWLEQMLTAGAGYQTRASALEKELKTRFNVDRDPTNVRQLIALYDRLGNELPSQLPVRSLAMARWFGEIDAQTYDSFEQAFTSFEEMPTQEALEAAVKKVEALQVENALPLYSEVATLRALYGRSEILPWDQPARLRRFCEEAREAERLTVDYDERAVPWLRRTLPKADHARLLAQDRIVGRGEDAPIPDNGYGDVREAARTVTNAWELRDQIYYELPTLATWLEHTDYVDWPRRVQLVVDRLHHLESILSLESTELREIGDVKRAHVEVESAWQPLRASFDDSVAQLIDREETDGLAHHQIDLALNSSLLSAPQRHELIDAKERFNANASETSKPDAGRHEPRQPAGTHFALQLLQMQEAADPLSGYAEQGERLRAHLRGIPDAPRADDAATRVENERLVRRASGMWFSEPLFDPTATLRKWNLQQLCLLQADRVLDEFRGTADGDRAFFAAASEDYVSSADAILPLSDEQDRRVNERRATQNQVASGGIEVNTQVEPRVTREEEVQVMVDLVATEAFDFPVPAGVADGSSGYVNVFLRALHGKALAAADPVALPISENVRTTLNLDPQVLVEAGSVLEAVASFRGHEYSTTFEADAFRGQRVEWTPPKSVPAQLTVFDAIGKEKSVIFILDCSRSMNAEMVVEDTSRMQMDIAGDALLSMLQELSTEKGMRVGVMLFGHRVGWSTDPDQPTIVLKNPKCEANGVEISDELLPSTDVESIVDLSRFDIASLGTVAGRMKGVQPWGQTPLYLSIRQALEQFARDDPDTEKSIVVITDGADNQFTPASSSVRTTATGFGEVRDALQGNPVPIYIVGFGVPEDERSVAARQFEELASVSNGAAVNVYEAASLAKSLRGLLGKGTYSVVAANGQMVGTATPLGQAITVPANDDSLQLDVNQSVTRSVKVPASRAIELMLSANKRDLIAAPYDVETVAEERLQRNDVPAALVLRAHRPMTTDDGAVFKLSIQSTSKLITPDFGDAWVEIVPLANDGQPLRAPYVFFDHRFELGEPVPVLKLTATVWPNGAAQAKLRIWLRDESAVVDEQLDLRDVLSRPAFFRDWHAVGRLAGNYQVRVEDATQGWRISVIEQSSVVPQSRVQVTMAGAAVDSRLVRRFDPSSGIATHAFTFSESAARRLRDSEQAALTFTLRSAVQDNAFTLKDGAITIPVYRSSGVLTAPAISLGD